MFSQPIKILLIAMLYLFLYQEILTNSIRGMNATFSPVRFVFQLKEKGYEFRVFAIEMTRRMGRKAFIVDARARGSPLMDF